MVKRTKKERKLKSMLRKGKNIKKAKNRYKQR